MFRYFLKPLFTNHKSKHCTLTIFRFIETQSASNTTNLTDKQSLTVSYLTESCGLSVQSAIKASRLVYIKNTERSDSVLELLRSHGFAPKDISTLISRYPRLILFNPVTNLRPKIEFLESLGMVGSELSESFIFCNRMLSKSLNKTIKPTFDFLKCYINTDENLMRTLRALNTLSSSNLEERVVPNVETLRDHNVPDSHIGKLILRHPSSLVLAPDRFKEVVTAVTEMGFDQKRFKFPSAVASMTLMSKATWDRKKEFILSLGWTDSDFDLAFSLHSEIMLTSEKKLREIMDFLVDKVGVKTSDISRCPYVFKFSLEKRLIPRWSLLQALKSKGLIGQNLQMLTMFVKDKHGFEAQFVTKYKDEVSEVINVYKRGIAHN